MRNIKKDVELYSSFDPKGSKSIDEIIKEFEWSREKSYSIKYFISELNSEELTVLSKAQDEINFDLIDAICTQKKEFRNKLLENIDKINSSLSPFSEIENLISQIEGVDPLLSIRNKFWIEVGNYLTARHIEEYPFTKKAIGFIKNIGFVGFKKLSRLQHNWIMGLIQNDSERPQGDRFFVNDHLVERGFAPECEIILKIRK